MLQENMYNKRSLVIASILLMGIMPFISAGEFGYNYLDSDMRMMDVGEVYLLDNSVATIIDAQNQWSAVNGTWIVNDDNYMITGNSSGFLIFNDNTPKACHMAFTLSVKSAGANDVVRGGVFKNGVLLNGSQIQLKLGQVGDVSSTAIHVMDVLGKGDTIQLHILNQNDADDLTVTYANQVAVCMN